jgi:hypothetical protein
MRYLSRPLTPTLYPASGEREKDTPSPRKSEDAKDMPSPRLRGEGMARPGNAYGARYFLLIPAPTVYFGSTKLPRRTLPHWLSIM